MPAPQLTLQNHCTKRGFVYSFYKPGLLGLLSSCYCADGQQSPRADWVVRGTDPAGGCKGADFVSNYLPSDQYVFNSCATGSSVSGGPAAFTTTDDASCFTTCADYKYLTATPQADGSYSCQCGSSRVPGSPVTCDKGVATLYTNNAPLPPTASKAARRNMIARELASRNAKRALCPAAQTACIIPGTDSFECLDTSVELETCGGCMHGVFDPPLDAEFPAGVDCTAMLGVSPSGVSCQAGKCVVSGCAKDHALQDGACMPLSA